LNANPVVSVVMAVQNCDRFIEEAIASVFAQTYSHWELLLVDDGSTDRTVAIIREYELRNPERVRYFEHPGHVHRGVSASRNLGMANARGTYIAFLDGDDVYLPFRLERHVALLEANPDVAMVQSDTLRWYSWSDPGMKDIRIRWPFESDTLVHAPGMLQRSFERTPRDGFFPSVCSVTLRRPAIEDIGHFDSRFAICEDWVFFSKLYLRKDVYITADVVAKYRKHRDSTLHRAQLGDSSALSPQYHFNLAYLRWLKQYLLEQDVAPALVQRARRQLWPDGSPTLVGRLGLPPALGLGWRTVSLKRLIAAAMPGTAQTPLRFSWRALRVAKRYGLVIARTIAVFLWSLPPPGS
jgi:glycosyltransferase involved in cell wall biosynthesis